MRIDFRHLSRAQRGLLLASVVVVMSVMLFGLAEGGLRIRHRIKFGFNWGIEDTYSVDGRSGLRIATPGGVFGGIRINSMGFRGPEIQQPKPPNTVRIAFLGSSTTYCADVSSNDLAWPHLVTKAVQETSPSRAIDYVNAGVPGYGVDDLIKALQYRVGSLQPDVVVIYEGHNDLSFNSFQLAVKQGIASKRTEQTLSWPTKYSLLWYLVEKNLMILKQQRTSEQSGKLKFDEAELVEPFHRELRDLVTRSQAAAKLVALVTFSTQIRPEQSPEQQTKAAVTSLYYMPYMSVQDLLRAYRAYNEVVRQVAEETGALLITEENSIPGDTVHFVDSIHFTDEGSRAQAQRVANGLINSPLLQGILSQAPRTQSSRQ